jgi:phosphoglycolate phosphatase
MVGYTESMAFYTHYRLRKTGVDELLDFLYSPEDHDLPSERKDLRKYAPGHYELRRTVHRNTPRGELKPNPHILRTILDEVGAEPERALYVGDSKMKDIAMAQEVGVLDAWAKYGGAQHTDAYKLLRRVSHWPDSAVEEEVRVLATNAVEPTVTLEAFPDLLDVAVFQRGGGK